MLHHVKYCTSQNTVRHKVPYNTEYYKIQNVVQHKVLYNIRYYTYTNLLIVHHIVLCEIAEKIEILKYLNNVSSF